MYMSLSAPLLECVSLLLLLLVLLLLMQVICHGIPDQRELQDGDIVNVDVTAFIGDYHGDLNETFTVGNVSRQGKQGVQQEALALLCW